MTDYQVKEMLKLLARIVAAIENQNKLLYKFTESSKEAIREINSSYNEGMNQ